MYKIYTSSGKNQRGFPSGKEKEAFEYYQSINDGQDRVELHYLFIAIFPENLYILESDIKQSNYYRKIFINKLEKES